MIDPADLTVRLIRCPSVTPDAGEAIALLAGARGAAGFAIHRPDRGGVPNLFARWGARGASRSFGFNGHLDVVPPGDPARWTHPPFSGQVAEGVADVAGPGGHVPLAIRVVVFGDAGGAERQVARGADAAGSVEPLILNEFTDGSDGGFDAVPEVQRDCSCEAGKMGTSRLRWRELAA